MNLKGKLSVVTALAATALIAAAPQSAVAAPDPAGCSDSIQYDPSIPTFKQYADANGIANNTLGGTTTGTSAKHTTVQLYGYFEAVRAALAGNTRVAMVRRDLGTTYLGQEFRYYVVGTPDNIANLDAGRNDGAFWRGVREGTISAEEGAAEAQDRPAFFWNTATPHGSEPAAGEAISRVMYELTARTDCANLQRLERLDNFLMPVTNPDGRDASVNGTRTTAYGFDPNRDFASRNQDVNATRVTDGIIPYPGPVYIDAHQQSSGYFFPPNEDPVLHEMSDFTIQTIQDRIGPALQQKFNDQSGQYRNYNAYDLFAVEYGDSVPSLQLGAAGMTFEKGTSENYGKQVYDHYLAMDETMNVISDDKDDIMSEWAVQWGEAREQGENGVLEENELVSPLTPTIIQEPNTEVHGYYYLPNNHTGDTAKLVREMRETGVHVYRLDEATTVTAADFADGYTGQTGPTAGTPITESVNLPAGTLFIPMDQALKHWIQGILGADPFLPVPYFYDVATWSFSQMRGMSGNGYLTEAMPEGVDMTEITEADYDGVTDGAKPVLAFPTDSAQGIAMMVELLGKGATVSRSEDSFSAGGKSFPTGTALVDTSTTAGIDLAALSDKRQTPITGLDAYPVARKALVKPKIGLYTGGATVPVNPLGFGGAAVGHCGTTNQTAFCEMLHVLAVNLGLPYQGADQVLYPVTSADLTPTNNLIAGNFTALIVPGGQAALTAGNATAVRDFVNAGGRYVSDSANGTTTARNAGFTNLNTTPTNVPPFTDPCPPPQGSSLQTPGILMTAEFDTDNPVAWGFDNGGFVYRQASSSPVYNPATLAGTPSTVPDTNVAIAYADPLTSYGYSCNAVGAGELPGRPYGTDSAFGAGHSTVLGSNPWYRSWVDVEWRMALNGALYPTGASIPAGPPARRTLAPENEPLAQSELPKVKDRPVWSTSDKQDARVLAFEGSKATMKRMLREADVPRSKRRKARYSTEGNDYVMVFAKAWTPGEDVKPWLFRLGQVANDTDGADTNIPARTH